jgi:hypothetical protein
LLGPSQTGINIQEIHWLIKSKSPLIASALIFLVIISLKDALKEFFQLGRNKFNLICCLKFWVKSLIVKIMLGGRKAEIKKKQL